MLGVERLLEEAFELLFELRLLFLSARLPLLLLLFKVVNLLLKHLNVQLELLLDLDVVTDLCLIVLKLLLILLRGQVKRLERAGKVTCGSIVHIETTWSQMLGGLIRTGFLLLLESELHKVIELCLNVGEDSET